MSYRAYTKESLHRYYTPSRIMSLKAIWQKRVWMKFLHRKSTSNNYISFCPFANIFFLSIKHAIPGLQAELSDGIIIGCVLVVANKDLLQHHMHRFHCLNNDSISHAKCSKWFNSHSCIDTPDFSTWSEYKIKTFKMLWKGAELKWSRSSVLQMNIK
jgi:hypothetical protein